MKYKMITFCDQIAVSEYNLPNTLAKVKLKDYEEIAITSELLSSFGYECKSTELVKCCIQLVGDKWWVTPLKTNYGCYKRIEKQYRIKEGETVFIGEHYLTYVKNEGDSAQCYLRYMEHTDEVIVNYKEGKTYRIGRKFVMKKTEIEDRALSTMHCQIEYIDGKLYIDDGGMVEGTFKPSSNGTWIKLEQKTVVLPSIVTLMLSAGTYLLLKS